MSQALVLFTYPFVLQEADILVVRNLGAPLGIRSALSAGAAGSGNVQVDVTAIQRDAVHILIGTPAKLNEVITARGISGGSECRLLVVHTSSSFFLSLFRS
jgi:superfamily II DNA/RNA helicase